MKILFYDVKRPERISAFGDLAMKPARNLSRFDPNRAIATASSETMLLLFHYTDCVESLPVTTNNLPTKWNGEHFLEWMNKTFGPNSKGVFYGGRDIVRFLRDERKVAESSRLHIYRKEVDPSGKNVKEFYDWAVQWARNTATWADLVLEWLGAALAVANAGDDALRSYIACSAESDDFPFSDADYTASELTKLPVPSSGEDITLWKAFRSRLLRPDYLPSRDEIVFFRDKLLSKSNQCETTND